MWYKQYGWKVNPFSIKPSSDLVDFEEERKKLVDYISGGNVCFLVGESGVGKTSLLKWAESNIKNHFPVYLNVENIDKNFSIKSFLHERTKLLRRLLGIEYPRNAVFLLDEVKGINEDLRNSLKLHFDENHVKSIVFCHQGEPEIPEAFKSRVGNRIIKLNKLTEEKSFELVKRRCGKICPFTEGAITLIIEKSGYVPRKILETCEKTCISSVGKKEITINDVQSILKIKEEIKEFHMQLSPMEETILKILKETNKTSQDLARLLNTTEGSVGKQLSKLVHKKLIKIISHQRPKVYGAN